MDYRVCAYEHLGEAAAVAVMWCISLTLCLVCSAAVLLHDPQDEHRLQRVLPEDQEGAAPDARYVRLSTDLSS